MRFTDSRFVSLSTLFRIAAVACTAGLIVACQPAPEERFASAEAYFSAADYRAAVLELKIALQRRPEYPEARYLLGRASFQLADFPTAQAEFERALAQGANRPEVWVRLGESLFAQGKATEVVERVVPNLPADSDDASQFVLLGDTLFALGNLDEAEENYEKALRVDDGSVAASIGMAIVANGRGDEGRARSLLRAAQERHPGSDLVWRSTGNFLNMKRDFAGAVAAYDEAIRVESATTPYADRLMARVSRVGALLDSRNLERANTSFDELQREFPGHAVVRFLRGRLAYANGDYALAETELREYLADFPRDLRGYALLGAVNFTQNHLRQAETYLSQAVRNKVGGEAALRLLTETQLRLQKPDQALQGLKDIGEPTDPMLLSMYGRAELGLGDTAAALEYFERGAAADASNPAVDLSIAAGFFAAGDSARAIEILEDIPDHEDGRYRREALLIAAHIREGDRASAQLVADKLLAENPEDSVAYATVGVMQQTLGDFVAARAALERARSLDAKNTAANFALGQLELLEGNREAGERLLTEILDYEPSFIPALVTLSAALNKEGRLADIAPRLERAIDDNPGALAPWLLRAQIALARDDFAAALETVRLARQESGDDARLTHAEGFAYLRSGQQERALRSFREAARMAPDNAVFQMDLAALQLETGDYRAAEASIARYRELQPESYRGLAVEVSAKSRLGDFDAARAAISEYARTYPDNPNSRILLGDVEFAAGNLESAQQHYEFAAGDIWNRAVAVRLARAYQATNPGKSAGALKRWLDDNPDDTEVRLFYAQLLEAQGRVDRAIEQYERINRTREDPVALNNLAWQYAMSGRAGAAELAERAHRLAPDNGNITDTYGWILYLDGDLEAALPILERAAEQSPDDPEIQFHLATVLAKSGDSARASSIIARLLESERSFPSRESAKELASTL